MPFLFLERTNIAARQYIVLSLPPIIHTSFNLLPCVITYLYIIIYLFRGLSSPRRLHEDRVHLSILFTTAHTHDNVGTQ